MLIFQFSSWILQHVPSAFAVKYLRNISETIKVEDCYGGEWIIHTFCSWRGWSLVLRGGWDEFFSDNDMQNGDVCLFELIQERDVVLKVLVFHAYLEWSCLKNQNINRGHVLFGLCLLIWDYCEDFTVWLFISLLIWVLMFHITATSLSWNFFVG